MKFTVIVPYCWSGEARDAAFQFVMRWWKDIGFDPLVGYRDAGLDWSKGAAVDSQRAAVTTDGLIIADADAIIDSYSLRTAIRSVANGSCWAMPHNRVVRLSPHETRRIFQRGADSISARRQRAATHRAPPGGGVVVLPTSAYDTVGGIDPRFVGWGGEDISFARALDTLCGPGTNIGGTLWHLYHPRTPRRPGNRACVASEELAGRYLDAEGDERAMRALVSQREPA